MPKIHKAETNSSSFKGQELYLMGKHLPMMVPTPNLETHSNPFWVLSPLECEQLMDY